jgi:hypothetical protein
MENHLKLNNYDYKDLKNQVFLFLENLQVGPCQFKMNEGGE